MTDKKYVTDAEKTKLANTSNTNSGDETTASIKSKLGISTLSGANTDDETANSVGAIVTGASAATPNNTDLVATVESSVVKKITWTSVKAFLKTYFDTLYQTISQTGNSGKFLKTDGSSLSWDTPSGGGGTAAQVDIYTTTGANTWTKPTGAKRVEVILIAGGGGGSSGVKRAAGASRPGGGGNGGAVAMFNFNAADLGSTETVTVGAGGAGGAAITANSTAFGNAGMKGGLTSFGNWLKAEAVPAAHRRPAVKQRRAARA